MPSEPCRVVCFVACLSLLYGASRAGEAHGAGQDRIRKPVFEVRSRVRSPDADGAWRLRYEKREGSPDRTAIIICDMWNRHWCAGATRRVAELAPRINEVVSRARRQGVLIVHAPSGTLDHYRDHPARIRARNVERVADLPEGIGSWCRQIPSEAEGQWPIDQSDGGCDCEPSCSQGRAWTRQIDSIEIHDKDFISDSGVEIWSLLERRDIENVILMGVHTNMCVLGRPFGLRNLVRSGKNVVLMRDLTDTMYNSRMPPRVSHFTGTDLVVEHIEKYVCPTTTSTAFTAKPAFRFGKDTRPRVVFISAESEYGAVDTLPALAGFLALHGGLSTEVLQGSPLRSSEDRNYIPGMRALGDADLAVLFVRRRALPEEDMKRLRDYLARGGPLIAFRTSSHAFSVRGDVPEGLAQWPDFDQEVLGCRYSGYPHGETEVTVPPAAADHPILKGVEGPGRVQETLYRHLPLAPTCRVLLMGRCVDGEGDDERYHRRAGEEAADQPVAWVNTSGDRRVFYTSLGSSRASMREGWFRRMILNAVFWGLDKPVPARAVKKLEACLRE